MAVEELSQRLGATLASSCRCSAMQPTRLVLAIDATRAAVQALLFSLD